MLAGNTDGSGSQDGPAFTTARLGLSVGGMAVAKSGEIIITDSDNNQIRKLSADLSQMSTLAGEGRQSPTTSGGTINYADGSGSAARFSAPQAVAVDAAGNTYVADTQNHLVRKISPTGDVTTLAGKAGVCGLQDGPASTATLCSPKSIATDTSGNVYVSQGSSTANPIRKITATGDVSTLVSKASLYPTANATPWGSTPYYDPVLLATDSAGTLYAADPNDHVIRKYTAEGQATVVSGTPSADNQGDADGIASNARFRTFRAMAFDSADRLHVLGPDNSGAPTIRRVSSDGTATTLMRAQSCVSKAGSIVGEPGTLCSANQMVVKANGDFLVAESGYYSGSYPYAPLNSYSQLRSYTQQGSSSVVAGRASAEGADDGQGGSARFDRPGALAFNPSGALYVRDNRNNTIRTVQADGLVRTLGKPDGHCMAVTGLGSEFLTVPGLNNGYLRNNRGPLATDAAGSLYTISGERVLKMKDCNVTLLADLKALLDQSSLFMSNDALGITADSTGNVYVSTLKGAIFKITPAGLVTLFAGNVGAVGHVDGQGTAAQFAAPGHMTIDAAGNLYVVDGLSSVIVKVGPSIRKITPSGLVSTLAGNYSAEAGYADGAGAAARFTAGDPGTGETASIATDSKGNVYVAEPANSVVRKITPDGQVSTILGRTWQSGFAAGDLPGVVNRPMGIAIRDSMLYLTVPNAVIQAKLP